MNYIELFGIVASLTILVSLTMTSIVKLRFINMIGCLLFAIYGYMIGSISSIFLNVGIAVINIYFLRKLYSQKDEFEIIRSKGETEYFDYFIRKNGEDIKKFFDIGTIKSTDEIYYLLRNNFIVGLLVLRPEGNTAEIIIDYMTLRYRDMKFGRYLYEGDTEFFKGKGYEKILQHTENRDQVKYLKDMGFEEESAGTYVKNIRKI